MTSPCAYSWSPQIPPPKLRFETAQIPSIETIAVNMTAAPSIQVWVFNYGETEVNITMIKISGGGNEAYYHPPDNNTDIVPNGVIIAPGKFWRFDIEEGAVKFSKGITISIRVESERENKAYETTKLP